MLARHIFETLARETRSAREAVDRRKDVAESQTFLYPEDELLLDGQVIVDRSKHMSYQPVFRDLSLALVAYGSDFEEYPRISPVVRWLLWMARWKVNAGTGVKALDDACAQFWCVGKKPGLPDIFAQRGSWARTFPRAMKSEMLPRFSTGFPGRFQADGSP